MTEAMLQHTLYTGQLASLEAELPEVVRALQSSDRLAETWVVVPNQLTRLHLRRVFTRSLGVTANIRALTLHELMRKLAEPLLLRDGWRTLPESIVDPLLARIVERLQARLQYLGPVAATRGFRMALMRTFQELVLARIAPQQLNPAQFTQKERAAKVRDLILLCDAIAAELSSLRLCDRALLQQLALTAVTHDTPKLPPLVLYALYELPPLSRAILESAMRATHTTALLPFIPDDADYNYTAPLRQWYLDRGCAEQRLMDNAPPPELHFVKAPDDSGVAAEILRDILYTAQTPDVAIVLPPGARGLAALLEDQCALIPLTPYQYQAKTLAQSAAGAGFAALADLLDGEFTLASVQSFLAASPFNSDIAADCGTWHRLAEEARIRAGAAQWRTRLEQLRSRLQYRMERIAERSGDEETATLAAVKESFAQCERLLMFVESLVAVITAARAATDWSRAVALLWDFYVSRIVLDESFADVTVQLEQAALLDHARVRCTPTALREFMLAALETPGERLGTFGSSTPLIAAREQFFGARFDHVFLPGFNEGTLPHADRQDPLLLDGDRAVIRNELHCDLPARTAWQDRERFFLALSLSSATRHAYLCIARANTEGRPQLVSSYATELLRSLHPDADPADDFDKLAYRDPRRCRIVSANALSGVPREVALHMAEFDRLSLGRALSERTIAPLRHLRGNPRCVRALRVEGARFLSSTFTPYDGLLTSEAARADLTHRYAPAHVFSPTHLERYWMCPFRAFVERELEAYAPEELSPLAPVTALDRGQLLHTILQRYHADRLNLPFTADNFPWNDLAVVTRTVLAEFARRNDIGSRYAAERLERDLLDDLAYYHRELLHSSTTLRTRHVEESFGYGEPPFPDAVRFIAANGEHISFGGRIDRWDGDEHGREIVITDYKSGKQPPKKSRAAQCRLQLSVYHLVAGQTEPNATVASRYVYFGDLKEETLINQVERDQRLHVAVDLSSDLRHGVFVAHPDPGEYGLCGRCTAKLACGAQRHAAKEISRATIAGLRCERSAPTDEGEDADAA